MPVDQVIAARAARSHGIVSRRELLDAGVSRHAIQSRLTGGRLHSVHPGVYAAGHPALTERARFMAAVLACGPGAALSHASAAALHRILPASPGDVEVLRTGPNREGPRGVRLRHTKHLEATVHAGVPVTTPARTLLDLAATGTQGRLEIAVSEAQALRLVTPEALRRLGRSGRPGARAIRAVTQDAPGFTRSEAERRLDHLILRAGLPRPRTNVRVQGHEVDALWPDATLIAEVDGYAAHGTRAAFERDRRRDAEHVAAGYRVVRITWRELTTRPEAVAARLGAALRPE